MQWKQPKDQLDLITFGLLSGIKMTSVFGTLINSAICWVICKLLNIDYSYMAALGDDLDL